MELFGIRLVGINEATGHKLLLSVALLALLVVLSMLMAMAIRVATPGQGRRERIRFWAQQARNLTIAVLGLLGLISIWFDKPANLTTAVGLATAGLAFALQKVVTSLAGYFLILRGETFTVGDRITMGGVRGDVVALGFFQTTILEMGQPPAVQGADPAMWVKSRQFTGRIVTVANSKIFDEPIYNYTGDFPFIWEEMSLPIAYRDNRQEAERILLEAARHHAVRPETISREERDYLRRRYRITEDDFEPHVYWRLTDNWLELTVRLITRDRGVRSVKDAMSREVLAGLDAAGIGFASSTLEVVNMPAPRTRQSNG